MTTRNKLLLGIGVVVVAAAGAAGWYFFSGTPAIQQAPVAATVGSVTETVTLSGQVQASEGVDLAFEVPGKIVANYVKVGDTIYAGEPLVAIDDSSLRAQMDQAQAQLDALDIGTVNATNTVTLQSLYTNALADAAKSMTVAQNALLTATDIQYNHFMTQDQQGIALSNMKAAAVLALLGQTNAGQGSDQYLAQLSGGTFGEVEQVMQNPNPTQPAIDQALTDTASSLQAMRNLLNAVPLDNALTSTERANLAAAQQGIAAEIITTQTNIQAIASAKVTNGVKVTTTNDQIAAAQANIQAVKTEIADTVITSPVAGKVDKDDVTIGQLASVGVPVITVSNNNLEIDTDVPEVDLPKVTAGKKANVTLDAFGTGKVFAATVVSVDAAPTMVDGIPAYAAKLKFNAATPGVQPGMTANITVIGDTNANVVLVPNTALIQQDANTYVMVSDGNGKTHLQQVQTGLRGDTQTEITSGISAGQQVIAY